MDTSSKKQRPRCDTVPSACHKQSNPNVYRHIYVVGPSSPTTMPAQKINKHRHF